MNIIYKLLISYIKFPVNYIYALIYIIFSFQKTWTAHPLLQKYINCARIACSLSFCIAFNAAEKEQ